MRIVAVADTHLFHRELEVPDGDVFVHAGDMCRGGSWKELQHVAGAWLVDGTCFVNCTTWECERAPTVIDVDEATFAIVVSAPPARRPR